jgi:curved DNA-binding protein CbpA
VANPDDLEKLCQGAKVWNAWRETNPDTVLDLTDANLTLSQRQFGPSSGGPINLRGANLAGATLRYATLSGADLEDAILAGADLVHARLDGANLTGADLTDAVCDNADLAGAKLDDAMLTGTSFAHVRNLTEDQIAFAQGDASTLLPATIMPPSSWFPEAEDNIYPEYREYAALDQMADEDLYEVLGVTRTAKPEIIRAAFRNLVKKYHPDLNPDDDEAQETFKKVSTAYRILNDAEKRVRYDKGEIGSDGEINPEFEARRQFRRHAFRFYAAAAMSLLLAGGVLGVVWHAVLTDDGAGRGRVEIAVATPPKSSGRLDTAQSDLKVDFRRQSEMGIAESAEDAVEAKSEILAQPPSSEAGKVEIEVSAAAQPAEAREDARGSTARDEPTKGEGAGSDLPERRATATPPESESGTGNAAPDTVPVSAELAAQQLALAPQQATQFERHGGGASEPAPSITGTDAKATDAQSAEPSSASPPPGTDAPPVAAQSAPPHDAKVTASPLFEEHKGEQARPAQADAARRGAPSAQTSPTAGPVVASVPYADRTHQPRNEALMRKAEGRKGARDAISALFRQRAVKQAMAQDQPQSTASVPPLAAREEFDAPEEVWDVYTHSIPDAGAAPADGWPGFDAKGKKSSARRKVQPAARDVLTKVPVREDRSVGANRKQAVSDILAGGL